MAFVTILGAAGCPKPEATKAESPAPDVEYSGCDLIEANGACTLGDDRELVLWVRGSSGGLAVDAGDTSLTVEWTPIEDGQRASVSVPEGAADLEVRRGSSLPWRLVLGDAAIPERLTEKINEARTLARNGDWIAAAEAREEAARRANAAGLITVEVDQWCVVTQLWTLYGRDAARARQTLARAAEVGEHTPQTHAMLAFYRAMFAIETGAFRRAADALRTALRSTERLAQPELATHIRNGLGILLSRLGRSDAAIEIFSTLVENEDGLSSGCLQQTSRNNLAFTALMAAEASGSSDLPDEALQAGLQACEAAACPDESVCLHALVNLGLGLAATDVKRASTAAQQARARSSSLELEPWLQEVEARIHITRGELAAAQRSYAALGTYADRTHDVEHQWRAAVGLARVARLRGQTKEAVRRYRQAQVVSRQSSLSIALGEGRSRFVEARLRATRELIDLLLEIGRDADAADTARTSRRWFYDQVYRKDQLERIADDPEWERRVFEYRKAQEALERFVAEIWSVPVARRKRVLASREAKVAELGLALEEALADLARKLPEPPQEARRSAAGLEIGFYPLEDTWLAYAYEDGAPKHVERVAFDVTTATTAAPLLAPFRKELSRTDRVRLVPHASLFGLDIHASRIGGRRLSASHRVTYSLGAYDGASATAVGPPLIVVDPRGDLPNARDEKDLVRARLRRDGHEPIVLEGPDATRAAVVAKLVDASYFHFAGHSRRSGLDGWGSELLLASATTLSVVDVLALPGAPRTVVLGGCEASAGPHAPLGVAEAFLLLGSSAVIAPTRVVSDRTARRFSEIFYTLSTDDAVEAFYEAILVLREKYPADDWAAYRMLIP